MKSRKGKPIKAVMKDGWIKCPKCKRPLARAYYGAECTGIETRCRCGSYVIIEIA